MTVGGIGLGISVGVISSLSLTEVVMESWFRLGILHAPRSMTKIKSKVRRFVIILSPQLALVIVQTLIIPQLRDFANSCKKEKKRRFIFSHLSFIVVFCISFLRFGQKNL